MHKPVALVRPGSVYVFDAPANCESFASRCAATSYHHWTVERFENEGYLIWIRQVDPWHGCQSQFGGYALDPRFMFESGLETAEAAEIEAVIDTREPNRRPVAIDVTSMPCATR